MPRRTGFSLIELVVVIMILGILAGVAVPKLLDTSKSATDNGLKQTLAVVRDAVERYVAENNGSLPGEAGTEADFKADIATFLRGPFPKCPVGAKNDQVAIDTTGAALSGDAAPTQGWKYGSKTGEFIVNSSAATQSDPTVNYDDL